MHIWALIARSRDYLCLIIMNSLHEIYMNRCIALARLGAGHVAPNPMVGSLLLHDGKIIGEGWHRKYGGPHAEVNAMEDALQKGATAATIQQGTLYVSLEPCVHYGKTPPCTDLIIRHRIPNVVVGCRDPFKEVDGKGIEKLRNAGIKVTVGILEPECRDLNKRFFIFSTKQRPYIILKWAETVDRKIAGPEDHTRTKADVKTDRLFISNAYTNRLVHRWRSEETAILVGTNTALQDNPHLTTRLWPGPSPLRMVIDLELRLPSSLNLFDRTSPTIVFNTKRHEESEKIIYYKINREESLVKQLLHACYRMKIQSLIVEGGSKLLQSFINVKCWDEARVISNSSMKVENGVGAPDLGSVVQISEETIVSDTIKVYKPS